ncbi:MAG: GNAT family N-acetyltransferase [Chloroflexi bacterium]|nr:GNAT family N-acetyltransferase [Chloroflexota bacterium]
MQLRRRYAVRVRQAVEADARALAEVHVASWNDTYRGLIPDAVIDARTVERREIMWIRILSDLEQRVGVKTAEVDGWVVGFLHAGPSRSPALGFSHELYSIYVHPEYLGGGVGRMLMSTVGTLVVPLGMTSLLAWVLRENAPARRFYESLGGVAVSERVEEMDGAALVEVAYGYDDLQDLLARACR